MLWRLYKKCFSYEGAVIFLCIIFCCIYRIFKINCIFFALTKVPCPTCGMGRALCALAKGEFAEYTKYNVMALPVTAAFLYELLCKRLEIDKRFLHICVISILGMNFTYYLFRLYLFIG